MRYLRLGALFASLILLVATAVSVVHRRGDVRDAQEASVELSSRLAERSVRSDVTRLRDTVDLTAAAASGGGGVDAASLAAGLASRFADAEVCVADSSSCTGADLFALDEVSDLLQASAGPVEGSGGSSALATVDDSSESLVVVRRVTGPLPGADVALRVPVRTLLGDGGVDASDPDTRVEVVTRSASTVDDGGEVVDDGDRREQVVTIGTPFVSGSIEITSSSTRTIGLAGEATAQYAALLALGTVLLALAAWTFLAERRQLERRATTDELTDLINRREFERVSEMEIEVTARAHGGLCVMVLDLNGFKQVNDTLGHQFGDLVLAASAERLVDAVRDTDVVGRWGGDEFVILLPGLIERSAVRDSAERIWRELSSTPVVGDTTMTASIGAAIFPRHGTTLESLMNAADVAMYEAKTTGVSHRIADTIAVNESLRAQSDGSSDRRGDGGAGSSPEIRTDGYVGTDRRRSPVPPPPAPLEPAMPPPAPPEPTPDSPVPRS